MRSSFVLAPLLLLSLAESGCALKLRLINYAVRKPSNVAAYFTVDRANRDPVPGLTADRFRIYEDDSPVSIHESKQTILNPEVAAVHYTLLLVDMSGSVTQSGQVPALQGAVQAFTQTVEKHQKVAVYAFDGDAKIHPLVGFGSGASAAGSVGSFKGRDPSTNLRGAVAEALGVLKKALDAAPQPLKFGTLVVFTDGTDRANRVDRDTMMKAINDSEFDIFVVGVGAEIDRKELSAIGRTGTVFDANPAAMQKAFETVAQRIEGYTKRFYLLSYCSPARKGERRLRVEAIAMDNQKGSIETVFNADGFGPQCDPNQAPPFDTSLRNRKKGADVGRPAK